MRSGQSQRRSRELADRYRALMEVGRTLTSTLGPEELYRVVHREASRVLEMQGFYIAVCDRERQLATVVFYADQDERRRTSVSYPCSEWEVIRTGKARRVSDRRKEGPHVLLGDATAKVTRSAISAPMKWRGRVLGVISVQSYRADAYGNEDLALLEGIAGLAAVALDNARTVAELERRCQESEKIEEIGRSVSGSLDRQHVLDSITSATIELVDAEGAAVWIVEDGPVARVVESQGVPELPEGLEWELEGGVEKRIRGNRRSIVVDDPEAVTSEELEPRLRDRVPTGSVGIVPLTWDGEVQGILTVISRRVGGFASEDLATLERLGSQASIALENARLHAQATDLSLTDPLTHLPNRRHLLLHLDRQMSAARRGRPLSVVMFDLDDFKKYNDTLGHLAGDEILRIVGEVLDRQTRAMNVAARYGGDEFVTVVTDTDPDGVLAHAERITDRIEEHPRLAEHGIRVSYGIARFGEEMQVPEDLLEAADRALYQAKDERRASGSRRGDDAPPRTPSTSRGSANT